MQFINKNIDLLEISRFKLIHFFYYYLNIKMTKSCFVYDN